MAVCQILLSVISEDIFANNRITFRFIDDFHILPARKLNGPRSDLSENNR